MVQNDCPDHRATGRSVPLARGGPGIDTTGNCHLRGPATSSRTPLSCVPTKCHGLTAYRALPALVVLPSTAEQTAAVVRECVRHDVPFVGTRQRHWTFGWRSAARGRGPHRDVADARVHRDRPDEQAGGRRAWRHEPGGEQGGRAVRSATRLTRPAR